MAAACFRFYAELNDFLAPDRRGRDSAVIFQPPVPVRHLIETFGVPHTEVEIVLLNGISVALEQPVVNGDRISVYPMFESLDVSPLLRLRERVLRQPRFLADAHLGRLAGYLRMLGFDTLYPVLGDDRVVASRALEQGRIILTRDRALLMRKRVTHGCYLHTTVPRMQLRYLLQRLDLCRLIQPFSRCIRCNGLLERVAREQVETVLPLAVRSAHKHFWRCRACARLYWRGSHYRHMQRFIEEQCPKVSGQRLQLGEATLN